jgi:hypothetical protein
MRIATNKLSCNIHYHELNHPNITNTTETHKHLFSDKSNRNITKTFSLDNKTNLTHISTILIILKCIKEIFFSLSQIEPTRYPDDIGHSKMNKGGSFLCAQKVRIL